MKILHQVPSARLEVGKYRGCVTHPLEIILGNINTGTFADGDEMEHSVGTATKDDDNPQCIFECLTGHDVRRFDIALKENTDIFARLAAFPFLVFTYSRIGR